MNTRAIQELPHLGWEAARHREEFREMGDSLVDLLCRLADEHKGAASGDSEKVVIGLVGRGIQSSRTPGMHEREARRLGIGYSYLLL
ncbi:MAG: hypothetical protein EOS51_32805, partial [Mesorhizobium sp.]